MRFTAERAERLGNTDPFARGGITARCQKNCCRPGPSTRLGSSLSALPIASAQVFEPFRSAAAAV